MVILPCCLATRCSLAPLPNRNPQNKRPAAHGWYQIGRRRVGVRRYAASDDEVQPVPPAMLSQLDGQDELEDEARWLSSMVTAWANEEWQASELEPVHSSLGEATAQAYLKLRQQDGMDEMGDLVLALAEELSSFDFYPTFTAAYEVSNKAVELLMLKQGIPICCTDRTAIARYEDAAKAAAKAAADK